MITEEEDKLVVGLLLALVALQLKLLVLIISGKRLEHLFEFSTRAWLLKFIIKYLLSVNPIFNSSSPLPFGFPTTLPVSPSWYYLTYLIIKVKCSSNYPCSFENHVSCSIWRNLLILWPCSLTPPRPRPGTSLNPSWRPTPTVRPRWTCPLWRRMRLPINKESVHKWAQGKSEKASKSTWTRMATFEKAHSTKDCWPQLESCLKE